MEKKFLSTHAVQIYEFVCLSSVLIDFVNIEKKQTMPTWLRISYDHKLIMIANKL